MREKSWNGWRLRGWGRAAIPPPARWLRPASGCMRPAWRQQYDPLHCTPDRTRLGDARRRLHSALYSFAGSARRVPGRPEAQLPDFRGNRGGAARAIRPGPALAGALLEVAAILGPGRVWI